MARKTVSQQKRMKKYGKKPKKMDPNANVVSGGPSSTNIADPDGTGEKNPIVTNSGTASKAFSTKDFRNTEMNHQAGCNCFLRRGQMFLPAYILGCNDEENNNL
jgi:hypothetical protein